MLFYLVLFLIIAPLYAVKPFQTKNELETTFVQRWSWYDICDFSYCNNHDSGTSLNFVNATPFNPEDVQPGNTIFITDPGIAKFLREVHPKIKNPYILVTYFSPNRTEAEYVNDPKLIAWFGLATNHYDIDLFDKFILVPLGIYRDQNIFNNRKQFYNIFEELRKSHKPKLLYMNFSIHTGRGAETEYRKNIYNHFKSKSFCTVGKPKQFTDYIQESAQHKFVLSPWGDMYDCYRHWEALLTGSIPIVETSPLDGLFEGLPVLIVNSFSEVTEEFLLRKYDEIKNKTYNFEKLYMKYWVDKINKTKEDYFRGKSLPHKNCFKDRPKMYQ